MAPEDVRWEKDDTGRGDYAHSYSVYCEWLCDDPEHTEPHGGFIVLTPTPGISVGEVINKLLDQDLIVRYLVRLPCYLSAEEIDRITLERALGGETAK